MVLPNKLRDYAMAHITPWVKRRMVQTAVVNPMACIHNRIIPGLKLVLAKSKLYPLENILSVTQILCVNLLKMLFYFSIAM